MASVSVNPVSNQFHIRFRFAGQAFKRSLKTAILREATAALARVEETLSLLQRGVLELPADADPATFLLSAGKTKHRPQKAAKPLTLGQLIDSYLKSLPEKILVIASQVQAKETGNVRESFHKLKGTGKTYGFPEVSELAGV